MKKDSISSADALKPSVPMPHWAVKAGTGVCTARASSALDPVRASGGRSEGQAERAHPQLEALLDGGRSSAFATSLSRPASSSRTWPISPSGQRGLRTSFAAPYPARSTLQVAALPKRRPRGDRGDTVTLSGAEALQ